MFRLLVIILFSTLCGVLQLPSLHGTQSGLEIVLAADLPVGAFDPPELGATARAIARRLMLAGYPDAEVAVTGTQTITVRLPGLTSADSAALLPLMTETGLLEFVDMSGLEAERESLVGQRIVTTEQLVRGLTTPDGGQVNPLTGQPFETVLSGDELLSAEAQMDSIQGWRIAFELTEAGGRTFEAFTSAHLGQPLAIVLDGEVLSIPVIQSPLRSSGVISGNFTEEEARALALKLNSGPLPLPIQLIDVGAYYPGQ